jgi:hypothetical protein
VSKALDDLALKKQLLQARSTLYRLRIRRDLGEITNALDWLGTGIGVAASLPVPSGLFRLALQALGEGRIARVVRFASRVILFARITSVAIALLRKSPR